MKCPFCKEECESVSHEFERANDELVFMQFECKCGCEFSGEYELRHVGVDNPPPTEKQHYQSEYERDNPRDPIIERS